MDPVNTRLWKFKFKHVQEFMGDFFYTESVVADTEVEAFRILQGTYGRLRGAVSCTGSEPIELFGYVKRAEPKVKHF